MDRQCPSCGGFCKESGCERENVKPKEKREWVGLTETEMIELAGGGLTRDERMIARAIEAKLKEKNGGKA